MRKILITLSLLLLASCTEAPPQPRVEPLKFTGPAYTFNVADVTTVEDYKSSKRPPNVELLADVSPAQAMRQWVGLKVLKAGQENGLEVNIKDASIIHRDLPKQKSGIEGMLTTEQTDAYDGTLEVELKIYSSRNALAVAHVTAKVQQSLTLPENAAPIDRERLYHRMTVYLMQAMEQQLDANIHHYMSNYLL